MCHAIIRATFRGETTPQQIDVETPEELSERLSKLRDSTECVKFRVFVTTHREDRVTTWEQNP
jgi:hypothetical protein